MALGRVTLTGASSDGVGTRTTSRVGRWYGGSGEIRVQGTFGGATLRVQWSLDDSTYQTLMTTSATSVLLTSAVVKKSFGFSLSPCYIRLHSSGGTSTTSLKAQVHEFYKPGNK